MHHDISNLIKFILRLRERVHGRVGGVLVHERPDLRGELVQPVRRDVEYDGGGVGGCEGLLERGEEGEGHAAPDGVVCHDEEGEPAFGHVVEEVLLPDVCGIRSRGSSSLVSRKDRKMKDSRYIECESCDVMRCGRQRRD